MLRILFDEDFNHRIIRGSRRRLPALDSLTKDESGFGGRKDAEVLRLAEEKKRLVVSHDVDTMSVAFQDRIEAGGACYGLLLVPQSVPIGKAVEELELLVEVCEPEEWIDRLGFSRSEREPPRRGTPPERTAHASGPSASRNGPVGQARIRGTVDVARTGGSGR